MNALIPYAVAAQAFLFLALFVCVVAGFAERLQVALIQKRSIATMRLDVIANQERGCRLRAYRSVALTTIAQEYDRAQGTPASQAVPLRELGAARHLNSTIC